MDMLGSECSSGCESGWTLYFEHSLLPSNASHRNSDHIISRQDGFCDEYWKEKTTEEEEEEELEDLSMVSDASSGPPHLTEDDACSHEDVHFSLTSKNRKGKKQKIKEYQCHEPSFLLDDTASSPALNFSVNNYSTHNQASMENFLDFSEGFSTSHFQERSEFRGHFGFLQPSLSGNQLQNNHWFEENGRMRR